MFSTIEQAPNHPPALGAAMSVGLHLERHERRAGEADYSAVANTL
jgi:hypothetical protein